MPQKRRLRVLPGDDRDDTGIAEVAEELAEQTTAGCSDVGNAAEIQN